MQSEAVIENPSVIYCIITLYHGQNVPVIICRHDMHLISKHVNFDLHLSMASVANWQCNIPFAIRIITMTPGSTSALQQRPGRLAVAMTDATV